MSDKYFFVPHPKQEAFIREALRPENSFLSYGGAAGGGKTFVGLGLLLMFCRFYPKSRWCVIRRSLTEIKLNTLPSFWKVCPTNFIDVWNKTEHTITFKNGSQIIFKGENIYDDPELMWMDGLEVNGFLLEQVEELSYKLYDKAKLRAGRHVIDPMPPIKILMTLNPAQSWVKDIIYKPYMEGTVAPPYCYVPAFLEDNPSLPKQYVDNLKHLDDLTYRRYVKGDWSAFAVSNPFAYAFSEDRHVGDCEYTPSEYLMISFDFNIDPITAIAAQEVDGKVRVINEFRLEQSNIYDLCDRITATYPNAVMLVTGDATGQNRSAITIGNLNYYTVIKQRLNLSDGQMKQPSINPAVSDSRVLTNSLLQNKPIVISPTCEYLIDDLKYVEVDEGGDIDKKKDKHKSHLLDCFRYLLNTFYGDFIRHTA